MEIQFEPFNGVRGENNIIGGPHESLSDVGKLGYCQVQFSLRPFKN